MNRTACGHNQPQSFGPGLDYYRRPPMAHRPIRNLFGHFVTPMAGPIARGTRGWIHNKWPLRAVPTLEMGFIWCCLGVRFSDTRRHVRIIIYVFSVRMEKKKYNSLFNRRHRTVISSTVSFPIYQFKFHFLSHIIFVSGFVRFESVFFPFVWQFCFFFSVLIKDISSRVDAIGWYFFGWTKQYCRVWDTYNWN